MAIQLPSPSWGTPSWGSSSYTQQNSNSSWSTPSWQNSSSSWAPPGDPGALSFLNTQFPKFGGNGATATAESIVSGLVDILNAGATGPLKSDPAALLSNVGSMAMALAKGGPQSAQNIFNIFGDKAKDGMLQPWDAVG